MKKDKKVSANSKINAKYQIVIPKEVRLVLKDVEQGANAYITVIDTSTLQVNLTKKSSASILRGLMSNVPTNRDIVSIVRKIRDAAEVNVLHRMKLPRLKSGESSFLAEIKV